MVEAPSEEQALTQARALVLQSVPRLVEKMVEKAATGSLPHTKFLFDFFELGESTKGTANGGGPSLRELLEEIRGPEEKADG